MAETRAGWSDGDVVRRVREGDVAAFATLVTRYRKAFGRYASAVCGDPDLAADAMQEAFIRAYDALDSCRTPERFGAWFHRILTNQCRNHRDRRRPHAPLRDGVGDAVTTERADDRVERAAMRDAITAALEELSADQREAFVLRHVEGRPYPEMAALTGEREDTLRMRVHRARETMQRRLEDWR